MLVQHAQSGDKGAFYIGANGAFLAEMVYSRSPASQKLIIEHTDVNELYADKEIGQKLIATGVAYARIHQLKIVPLCSFAKTIFDKNDSFRDVLG
jgi:hypothetical protein